LQDAHADWRGWVVQANRQEAALIIENNGQVARLTRMALLEDGLIKDPGMTLAQGMVCLWADPHCDAPGVWVWETRKGAVKIHDGWVIPLFGVTLEIRPSSQSENPHATANGMI
jgi:hypothetical protein